MTFDMYETLKLLARGLTTPQIAKTRGVSYYAAQDTVKRLLAYFDAANRTELATICHRQRIV